MTLRLPPASPQLRRPWAGTVTAWAPLRQRRRPPHRACTAAGRRVGARPGPMGALALCPLQRWRRLWVRRRRLRPCEPPWSDPRCLALRRARHGPPLLPRRRLHRRQRLPCLRRRGLEPLQRAALAAAAACTALRGRCEQRLRLQTHRLPQQPYGRLPALPTPPVCRLPPAAPAPAAADRPAVPPADRCLLGSGEASPHPTHACRRARGGAAQHRQQRLDLPPPLQGEGLPLQQVPVLLLLQAALQRGLQSW